MFWVTVAFNQAIITSKWLFLSTKAHIFYGKNLIDLHWRYHCIICRINQDYNGNSNKGPVSLPEKSDIFLNSDESPRQM